MRVICEISDCLNSTKIKISSSYSNDKIELEVDGKRYTILANELISAVNRAKLDAFGK